MELTEGLSERFRLPVLAVGALALVLVAAVATATARAAISDIVGAEMSRACSLSNGAAGVPPDENAPDRIGLVSAADPSVLRIGAYIVTDDPGRLQVIAETGSGARNAGAIVDVSQSTELVRGLREPSTMWGSGPACAVPWYGRDGHRVGTIVTELDPGPVDASRRVAVWRTILAIALSGVAISITAGLAARREDAPFVRPVGRAATDPGGDPVSRRIDMMSRTLSERSYIRDTFGRYVGDKVAEVMSNEDGPVPGAVAVDATLLRGVFEGVDELAAVSDPGGVVALLDAELSLAAVVIDSNGGYLVEWGPTGFLAVFGAPNQLPDHIERANRAADQIREKSAAISREWERGRLPGALQLTVRTRTRTGPCIMGNVGPGYRSRLSVVGRAVSELDASMDKPIT